MLSAGAAPFGLIVKQDIIFVLKWFLINNDTNV